MCISKWKSELIPNALGEYLTPSVVGYDDDGESLLIGKIAKDRLITHPSLTQASFKRFMGTDTKLELGKKTFTATELSILQILEPVR